RNCLEAHDTVPLFPLLPDPLARPGAPTRNVDVRGPLRLAKPRLSRSPTLSALDQTNRPPILPPRKPPPAPPPAAFAFGPPQAPPDCPLVSRKRCANRREPAAAVAKLSH